MILKKGLKNQKMNKILVAFAFLLASMTSATAFGLSIELREYKDRVCYDGDTCYVIIKALPEKLEKMSIRVLGIDTPEIRGKCAEEKELALKARIFANKVFRSANKIEFKNLQWGKYGGRLLSDVYLDDKLYSKMIIDEGLARPYDGKTKKGWC